MSDEEAFGSSSDRLVHALLCGLHDRSSDARVRLVMREIDARPRRHLSRIAAVFLVGSGILIGLFLQSSMPDAQAVMQRATLRAEEDRDRQYRVTISFLRSQNPDPVTQGTMHVRGTRSYAYEHDGIFRKGWMGSDGTTTWYLPEGGEPREWPAGDESRWRAHHELRYASMDTYVQNLEGRFDLSVVGREGPLLHLRATRKLAAIAERVSQVDFWVAEKSKLIMKSHSRLEFVRLRHPLLVTYEYLGDRPRTREFYTLKGHSEISPETKQGSEK